MKLRSLLATLIAAPFFAGTIQAGESNKITENEVFQDAYKLSFELRKINEQENNKVSEVRELKNQMNWVINSANNDYSAERRKSEITRLKRSIANNEARLKGDKLKLKIIMAEPVEKDKIIKKVSAELKELKEKEADMAMPFDLKKAQLKDSISNIATKKILFKKYSRQIFKNNEGCDRNNVNVNFENGSMYANWYKGRNSFANANVTLNSPYSTRIKTKYKLLDKYPVYRSGERYINFKVGPFYISFSRSHSSGTNIKDVVGKFIDLDKLANIKINTGK